MGILVADRKFFGEIGSLDGGMKIYGGENVELGIRVRFSGCFEEPVYTSVFCFCVACSPWVFFNNINHIR